jgi:hypothetical protein
MPIRNAIVPTVATLALVAGVTVLSTKPAAVPQDRCIAQVIQWARDGRVVCALTPVATSRWPKAADTSPAPTWLCNGGVPPDQGCISAMAGAQKSVTFAQQGDRWAQTSR